MRSTQTEMNASAIAKMRATPIRLNLLKRGMTSPFVMVGFKPSALGRKRLTPRDRYRPEADVAERRWAASIELQFAGERRSSSL